MLLRKINGRYIVYTCEHIAILKNSKLRVKKDAMDFMRDELSSDMHSIDFYNFELLLFIYNATKIALYKGYIEKAFIVTDNKESSTTMIIKVDSRYNVTASKAIFGDNDDIEEELLYEDIPLDILEVLDDERVSNAVNKYDNKCDKKALEKLSGEEYPNHMKIVLNELGLYVQN